MLYPETLWTFYFRDYDLLNLQYVSLTVQNRKSIVSLVLVQVSSCSNTGSIRDDPYWTSRKNSLELIELSSINIVSLILV